MATEAAGLSQEAAAAPVVRGPQGREEEEELAAEILERLAELAVAEPGERDGLHGALIPLLERAIFTPDDNTMRAVYRRIYGSGSDVVDKPGLDRFDMMRAPLVRLSKAFGEAWSRPQSKRLIPLFRASYGVSMEGVLRAEHEFESLNEFFYRDIDVESCRPLEASPDSQGVASTPLSSMADSHIMVFRPWSRLRGLVVKNSMFTVDAFLGGEETGFGLGMEGGTVVCVRLHPSHIHRAYAPLDACVGQPWQGGIAYHTTKPVGIESLEVDTLCENKRVVVPLQAKGLGTFYAVFVGGPLIGSVVLQVAPGQEVARGQELAYFSYGGSAIYMCFPADFPAIEWLVPENLALLESQEVRLRSTIGRVGAEAPASAARASRDLDSHN